jgi:hypothetical protein
MLSSIKRLLLKDFMLLGDVLKSRVFLKKKKEEENNPLNAGLSKSNTVGLHF